MSSQQTRESYKGLLSSSSMGVGWALFILLHGVESYALRMAGRPWPFNRPDSQDGGPVLLVLCVVCLLSSFLVGGFVENDTRYDPPVRWLRWLRFALASVPLLGLYIVPLWGWVAETRPSWAFAESGRRHPESQGFADSLRISRGWYLRVSNIFLLSVLVVNAVALQALLAWLLSPDWSDATRSKALACARLALRATGFMATIVPNLFFYHWKRITHRAFPFTVLCCLAWLAPWPVYALALAPGFFGGLGRKKKRLLTTIAYTGRARLSERLEEGGGMDWWQSSLWQRQRSGWIDKPWEASAIETRLIFFYRIKTFLLILDASALVLIAGRCGQPWITRVAADFNVPVADSALLLIPIVILLVARSAEILRTPDVADPLLFWRYSAFVLGAVFFGAHQAALLLERHHLEFAMSLVRAGFVTGTSVFVLNMPFRLKSTRRSDALSSVALWIALFLGMALAGQLIIEADRTAAGIIKILELCALLAPVWGIAAGLSWGRSLIEPFHPRDLFSRRLEARSRALLACLILSAVLPFGGLATPLWREFRARLLHSSITLPRESAV